MDDFTTIEQVSSHDSYIKGYNEGYSKACIEFDKLLQELNFKSAVKLIDSMEKLNG